MAKILVVDDELEIREVIKEALVRDGHLVYTAKNADDALEKLKVMPDLLLLDVMMPGKSGFEFCREIRSTLDIPILFITAKISSLDLIEGLAMGADDYIKKPFSVSELRAIVNANLRREKRTKRNRLVLGEFVFDLSNFSLQYRDRNVNLTKTEYDIAEHLALNQGQVFSKQQLFDIVWDSLTDSNPNTVAEHIKNLRKKLIDVSKYDPIQTIWGLGYKWRSENEN